MNVRAILGATTVEEDSESAIAESVCELLQEIFAANEIEHDSLISILFTSTPDLVATFPATAARALDLGDVPLMCAVEIAVPGALPKTIRVLVHTHSHKSLREISHIYLRGAKKLRADLAQ